MVAPNPASLYDSSSRNCKRSRGTYTCKRCRGIHQVGGRREGRAASLTNDKVHFYNVAQASFEELRYYLILCRDLGCALNYESFGAPADHIGRMLHGLIESVKR